MAVDLVLSSGFLAFSRQAAFLAAVEDAGLPVDGLCGTSSGALAGALWASGLSADAVLAELTARVPLATVALHARPWRGLLSMGPVIARLRDVLPATFEALPRPFGVGVVTPAGHAVLTSGPLPEAVAASCAIPWLFAPVDIAGVACADGGVADRTGLAAWRAHRGERPTILHLVERTSGAIGGALPDDVRVVRSPRSGAKLWSLGDIAGQFADSRARCHASLLGAP